jgi:hypothetical protein
VARQLSDMLTRSRPKILDDLHETTQAHAALAEKIRKEVSGGGPWSFVVDTMAVRLRSSPVLRDHDLHRCHGDAV